MKEHQLAKLRALNEKTQLQANNMDEIRAKRSFDNAEREARKKEADEAQRIAKINHDLRVHRVLQQQNRQEMLARQAQQAKEEYERDIAVFMQQEIAEKKRAEEECEARLANQQQLRQQIANSEEKRLMARQAELEDGAGTKAHQALERKRLGAIKTKKIQELQQSGVPEKYWAELARKKIVV